MIVIAVQLLGIAFCATIGHAYAVKSNWLWIPYYVLAGGFALSVASHMT